MDEGTLIPHLFRTEYRKLTAVLGRLFGLEHLELAEDIASETFLLASETWAFKGIPENPVAWLYVVAKNKARDFLKREALFRDKIRPQLSAGSLSHEVPEIDLSGHHIDDSQLQMMFAVCHPSIPAEAQVALSLRILCGFGIGEIAAAFMARPDAISKRLQRAREKLRTEKIKIELPGPAEMQQRLETVLTTLYLLFSEGYYSLSGEATLRRDLCLEAMRLTHMLVAHQETGSPAANALLSLMCFQASRFEARVNAHGELVLYEDQDRSLWDTELIDRGSYYLVQASRGEQLTKYHLEAAIAWWHTRPAETEEKWPQVLQLYNQLLLLAYSPAAALNRTYALAKVQGTEVAIREAEQLGLEGYGLYHALLGELYTGHSKAQALEHWQAALRLSNSEAEKAVIARKMKQCAS